MWSYFERQLACIQRSMADEFFRTLYTTTLVASFIWVHNDVLPCNLNAISWHFTVCNRLTCGHYYFQELLSILCFHVAVFCVEDFAFTALPFSISLTCATRPRLWPDFIGGSSRGRLFSLISPRLDLLSSVFAPSRRPPLRPPWPVRRFDARASDCRMSHCLRFATTKRTVDTTITVIRWRVMRG